MIAVRLFDTSRYDTTLVISIPTSEGVIGYFQQSASPIKGV